MFISKLTTVYDCSVDPQTEAAIHAVWATLAHEIEEKLDSKRALLWSLRMTQEESGIFAQLSVSNSIMVDGAWGESNTRWVNVPVGQVVSHIHISNNLTLRFHDSLDVVNEVSQKLAEYRADWLKEIK